MRNNNNTLLYAFFGLIGIFLLVRVMPYLIRPLLLILAVTGIVVLVFYLVQQWKLKNRGVDPRDKMESGIHEKLDCCKKQIATIKKERAEIESNISSLATKLQSALELTPQTQRESERLIQEFQNELDLRNTKLQFYESCTLKLRSLHHNFQLSKEINEKQQTLKRLRESNEEDIANFEELKTALEFEQTYLNTIDELSLKMLDSNSLQDAKALQLELETITKELRDL
ncbi:MAG: hypothetical protein AAGG68_09815 [Bacteroidota bacterium]